MRENRNKGKVSRKRWTQEEGRRSSVKNTDVNNFKRNMFGLWGPWETMRRPCWSDLSESSAATVLPLQGLGAALAWPQQGQELPDPTVHHPSTLPATHSMLQDDCGHVCTRLLNFVLYCPVHVLGVSSSDHRKPLKSHVLQDSLHQGVPFHTPWQCRHLIVTKKTCATSDSACGVYPGVAPGHS